MFLLKKLLAPLLAPLNFSLLLLLIGIVLLWFTTRQRTGKVLVSLATSLLLLASCRPLSDKLLIQWESSFSTIVLNATIDSHPTNAAQSIAVDDIAVANNATVANQTTAANNTSLANQTTVANNTSLANQTTAANNTSLANQTTAANNTSLANQTTAVNNTSLANQTTVANNTSLANQTTAANNTSLANQTTAANNTSLANQTTAANQTTSVLDATVAKEAIPRLTIRWIVVLGGGHTADSRLPATGQLSTSSLARLVEGIRLYRQLPHTKLVVSGGPGFTNTSDGKIMAQAAQSLGVPVEAIVAEMVARDTEQQAQLIKPIVQQDPFILVTSANHLPRAMALFQRVGLQPIPAPADFQVKYSPQLTFGYFYPSVEALNKTDRSFYELWGWWWAKVRGKI